MVGVIEMSEVTLACAASVIIDHLKQVTTGSYDVVSEDRDGVGELELGSVSVKQAVRVSEACELELSLVDDVNATPLQHFARSVIVAQRYLPMAFPNLMYS